MAERYPREKDGTILPSTEPEVSTKQPDLLSKFIQAKEARPEFMNDKIVTTLAVSMAFAGSETTAITLSAVFYYLLKTPAAMQKLREELDEHAKSGFFSDSSGLVTWAESQKLPYLDACIKEAFRMHPAAGLPLERIVPPQGAEIAGHRIAGGTIVGCSAWVIHRRPEIFGEDVDVYNPERWLVDESKDKEAEEKRIKEMNGTLFQFGMGARTCIGKNISLLEVYKLVPSVLRRFEVSIPFLRFLSERGLIKCRLLSKILRKNGNCTMHGSLSSSISVPGSAGETSFVRKAHSAGWLCFHRTSPAWIGI